MAVNIIRNEKIKKHNVEPYRFKVLGSASSSEEIEQEIKEPEITPIVEKVEPQPEPQQAPIEDSFVEKLLKKTDELSSNMIKLQMQLENQEAEFEKRLQEDTLRAKEEGQQLGEELASVKFNEQLQNLQSQYSRSISLLENECNNLNEFIKKNESELSGVAIEIAKEVIQKELNDNSSLIAQSLATSLLKELQADIKKQIKVNPKDFELLEQNFADNEFVEIKADEAISQGGIIILSQGGNIEGTISKRLEKFIQIMDE